MDPDDAHRSFKTLCAAVTSAAAEGHHDVVAELLIKAARAWLDGRERGDEEELALLLKQKDQFGYARRLFRRLLEEGPAARREFYCQQYALCVYRDLELPSSRRYQRALEILEQGAGAHGWSGESLGLCGAIYKRRWQAEGKVGDLERAYQGYRQGYELSDDARAYCGINAAYLLDALASIDGSGDAERRERRDEASAIRKTLVTELAGGTLDAWDAATLAEAQFGLRNFAAALEAMCAYKKPKPEGWQRETTASQLADLARLLGIGVLPGRKGYEPEAAAVLQALVGKAEPLMRRAVLGKVGLALSGGGFRASLFHIGVLARLAERDALRGIEVLSCVSGGSIVGAFYYLRVRQLLNSTPDRALTPDDYIALVERLAKEFLGAVQRNPRVELTGSIKDNFKMAVRRDFSRTNRVAELLQQHVYAQVKECDAVVEWRMSDLLISPEGRKGFSPRYGNWEREAKVPILVVNATTLNTGHSWQFTASQMGEPPDALDEQIDANSRLRRMYYDDAPPPYSSEPPRLADAVAASACVPALFPPIRLDGLYEGRIVELVDGGVHDNQGVASLIEQECTTILVSDASGQMGERPTPRRSLLSVATRSNSILQSRVRGAQLADLSARQRAGTLRRLMIVHLKKGLPATPVDWGTNGFRCPDPFTPERGEHAAAPAAKDSGYGINEAIQRALADVRTDLDSFSDTEAYALMAAGYKMACVELDRAFGDELPDPIEKVWPFTPTLDRLAHPERELKIELDVAKERFGKWFRVRWRRRSTGSGRMKRALRAVARNGRRGGGIVAVPVRVIVGAPASVIGAGATRVYMATLGRVRR